MTNPISFIRNKIGFNGESVICNNCTGTMVLHGYGIRFETPTVICSFC